MSLKLLAKGVVAATILTGVSASQEPAAPQTQSLSAREQAELQAIMAAAYLPRGGAPDSLAILPAPPEAGSAAQARDDEAARAGQALRGSPRWAQATQDANLDLPGAAQTFECALGVAISEAGTPHTYTLLRRSMADVGLSTYPTKTKYQRTRPFVVTSTEICTPEQAEFLRHDGSYPSGHSAIGWGWALILTEAAPDRQNQVLARGRAFGQSRVVCNVHWLSDTEEGRVMASATVARLQAAPEFQTDLAAARAEIAAARTAGSTPTRDCAVEAAQLAG
ncbi:acid phosphatase [Brevundimonas sp. Root1279]|uniref:acid phosphatase n=1 Tax=Brevundimonas sp. Root1279 TaxID=1736443 RepID=UPI0006F3B3B8|nr:phosphatase PAP2 family protein [Brevundimonas sp. Root1279]KQW83955.1 acid phosphatase [Brevundimonas sp. Root1279]